MCSPSGQSHTGCDQPGGTPTLLQKAAKAITLVRNLFVAMNQCRWSEARAPCRGPNIPLSRTSEALLPAALSY